MAEYQVTVRYGNDRQRYHIFTVEAAGTVEALRKAAEELPDEVAVSGNLVELRAAVDPEGRSYLGET